MKNSLDITKIPKLIGHFLRRYNLVIFVVIVAGSMAAIVLFAYQIVQSSSAVSDAPPPSATFDQVTIEKVNSLKSTSNQTPLVLPPGRTNPFGE